MTKQILAFLFCFKRELNLYPHLRARTQTLYSPLTSIPKPSKSLYSRAKKHGARIEQKISLQHATL